MTDSLFVLLGRVNLTAMKGSSVTAKFQLCEPGAVAFYPIPPCESPLFKHIDTSRVELADRVVVGPFDTALIIGHTSFDPDLSLELLEDIHTDASVFVQGPGFNLGLAEGKGISGERKFGESLDIFKSKHKKTLSYAGDVCPSYSLATWKNLIAKYPPPILEVHQFGVMTSLAYPLTYLLHIYCIPIAYLHPSLTHLHPLLTPLHPSPFYTPIYTLYTPYRSQRS